MENHLRLRFKNVLQLMIVCACAFGVIGSMAHANVPIVRYRFLYIFAADTFLIF